MVNLLCLLGGSFSSAFLLLELSMLLFILVIYLGKVSLESCFKYFMVQSFSSVLFLFCFLSVNSLTYFIVVFSILIKLGIFPFHQWMISLCDKLDWDNIYYLITVQKIIPLYLLSFFRTSETFKLLFFISVANVFVRLLGCFNHSNFRLIYGFISMFHQSWVLLGVLPEVLCGFLYLGGYIVVSVPLVIYFYFRGTSRVSSIGAHNFNLFVIFLNLGLLAGLPPRSGFLLKVYVGLIFIYANINISLFVVLFRGTLFFYIYCRLFFICLFAYTKKFRSYVFCRDLSIFSTLVLFVALPLVSLIF